LKVQYESRDRVGPQNAVIAISTDDPEQPAVTIDVVAYIEVLVMARPPNGLTWGLARRGSVIDKVVSLVPGNRENDIELLSVTARDTGVTVTAEKAERQGERMIELRFQLDRELPLGEYATTVEARIRVSEEEAVVTIPVRGQVIGDVIVSPPAIVSPKTAYAQGQRISEITVRSSGEGPPPALLGAMAVGPVRATVLTGTPEDRHVISVSAAASAPGGPQSGFVYVMTASSDQPVIGVPVYFRVASPVDVVPAQVVLVPGTDTEQRVELRSRGKPFAEITDVGFESDVVSAEVEARSQSGPDVPAALLIRLADAWTPAKTSTIVVLETNVPGGERLYVPVVIRHAVRPPAGRLEPAETDAAE
jgi:hypothetical protein